MKRNYLNLGSKTAKGGFANEKAICKKFNSWKNHNAKKRWNPRPNKNTI